MTNTEAREVFNQVIAQATDADTIARLELSREYFTNPEFRAKLEEFMFQQAQAAS